MILKRGDIIILKFPYSDKPGKSKLRPALVIQNDVGNKYSDNTIIAMISSVVPEKIYPVQVLIPSDSITGLDEDSVVDVGVIFTVTKKRVKRKIGECSGEVMEEVDEAIRISLDI